MSKMFTNLKLAGAKKLEGNLGKRKMNSKEPIPPKGIFHETFGYIVLGIKFLILPEDRDICIH